VTQRNAPLALPKFEHQFNLPTHTVQRVNLDLDQRNIGQQSNRVTDAIFADDELFEDEWFDFGEERSDFWNDVFENELLSLKSGF